VSDHPTKDSGGDLGMVTEDQLNPAIRDQLRKLKVGEVSEVFGSADSAWIVLKLSEIGALDDSRLKKMSEEIRSQLTAREYQRQIGLWLERMRQEAFVHRAGAPSVAAAPGGR
jgi:parvulin-like peptidyl-prolyl isomerase